MRTDRILSDDRAETGARRRRVEFPGFGADGGPGPRALGGAARRAQSEWPSGNFPGEEVEFESHVVLENDPALIPPMLAELYEAADRLGLFDAGTADRVAVALTEALLNGIQHGNLELDSRLREEDEAAYGRMAEFRRRLPPYRDRRLHVRVRLSRREAVYMVRDEGPGFDPTLLPDPTDPAHIESTTGRGLLLIRAFMDEVAFNRAGNEITLLKRRTTPPNAHDL